MGAKLGASKSVLPVIPDVSPAGMLALDSDGRVTALNNVASELLGAGRATIVGTSLAAFVADDSVDRLGKHLLEAANGDGPVTCEVEVTDSRGRSRYFLLQTLADSTDDPTVAYRSVVLDVTGYVERVESADQARRAAERLARSKSDFLARLSHEIRSALASMIGFADLLTETVPEKNRELTEIIRESGRHLLDTLNSVMDLARLEFDGGEIDVADVDVVQRVGQRMPMFEKIAAARGLEFTFRAESEAAFARLNGTFLERVVHNLVDNAIKYTPAGRVEVSVEQREERVWIYVADTGIGIPEDFVPRLFSPFEREKRGGGTAADGVGLGLAITKYLVELMGGRIVACSTKGSGSTFTVSFPALDSASKPAPSGG